MLIFVTVIVGLDLQREDEDLSSEGQYNIIIPDSQYTPIPVKSQYDQEQAAGF